jgi:hypothetical protein
MKMPKPQDARAWRGELEALLLPLWRLTRRLEGDLEVIEEPAQMHQLGRPVVERLCEAWERGEGLQPVRAGAHVRAGAQRYRVLGVVDRQVCATCDTPANRVLLHALQLGARLAKELARAADEPQEEAALLALRDQLCALAQAAFPPGQRPGPMLAHDPLHRALRGPRYQPAWALYGLTRGGLPKLLGA